MGNDFQLIDRPKILTHSIIMKIFKFILKYVFFEKIMNRKFWIKFEQDTVDPVVMK